MAKWRNDVYLLLCADFVLTFRLKKHLKHSHYVKWLGKGDLVGCDISKHLQSCSNGQGGTNQHGTSGSQDVIVKSSSDVKVNVIFYLINAINMFRFNKFSTWEQQAIRIIGRVSIKMDGTARAIYTVSILCGRFNLIVSQRFVVCRALNRLIKRSVNRWTFSALISSGCSNSFSTVYLIVRKGVAGLAI